MADLDDAKETTQTEAADSEQAPTNDAVDAEVASTEPTAPITTEPTASITTEATDAITTDEATDNADDTQTDALPADAEADADADTAVQSVQAESRSSIKTIPKLQSVSADDLSRVQQRISEYTSILDQLRACHSGKDIQALTQPLLDLDATQTKEDMYAIPATQILHQCLLHETSIAQKPHTPAAAATATASAVLTYPKRKSSILRYLATNALSSSLGTSLLCNEGITLKQLRHTYEQLRKNGQLSVNSTSERADAQSLLTLCHKIHKSYQSVSAELEAIACLVIDVDNFFQLNRQFGRAVGDNVLLQIAKTLYETVKQIHRDIMETATADNNMKCGEFYHGGNNRFYVLLSVPSEEKAMEYGKRLSDAIKWKSFAVQNSGDGDGNGNELESENIKRTVCVSVYIYNPRLSVNAIKCNAHLPLLWAKRSNGRTKDRVVSYSMMKREESEQTSDALQSEIWSKQLYDLMAVHGKYSYHLCRAMTKRLVSHKHANLNWQNPKDGGNTLLLCCLEHRFGELVYFLTHQYLNSKLDVNVARADGANALLLSIKYDFDKEIVEKILQHTHVENRVVTNTQNENTLQLAQSKGLHSIVQALQDA